MSLSASRLEHRPDEAIYLLILDVSVPDICGLCLGQSEGESRTFLILTADLDSLAHIGEKFFGNGQAQTGALLTPGSVSFEESVEASVEDSRI